MGSTAASISPTASAEELINNSLVDYRGTVGDPYTGASYVSTDSAGRLYVFDSATGFHQFQDTAVPEPSTYVLAITGLLGAVILRRRRHRNS